MKAAGFLVTVRPDGGISFPELTAEQSKAMEAAFDICDQQFPVDPRYEQALNQDQLEALYNWYVEESIPCLEELGYTGFEPSSLDTFIDSYDTGPWTPYNDLGGTIDQLRESDWYALQEACPQGPPLELLYP
jgi:hypothetical protein